MKRAILYLILGLPIISHAQSNNAPSTYDPHDIKITGYLQSQFQHAQSDGITSFSAGDFNSNSNQRFMIRRGRLKIDRVDNFSSVVFQIDATQDGVRLMDAFIQLNHPNYKPLRLTAGLFNRPFGYSIVYSSGYRDFPERPRVFQTLMPRERDLGAMLSFQPENEKWKFLHLDFAVISGSGLSAKDYDNKQDLVGNLAFKFDKLAEGKMDVGFGGSIYKGYVRNNTSTYFTPENEGYTAHTGENYIGKAIDRSYYGLNLQLGYESSFGATTLKGEFVTGNQPGVASSENILGPYASQSFSSQPKTDLYKRNFSGAYIWFTQEIAKTGLTAIASFDTYDPNIKSSGLSIGQANNTNSGDIKYNTLGYGLTYGFNKRVKFTLYNEHISNEKTSVEGYTQDLKDNVFTARIQYRW